MASPTKRWIRIHNSKPLDVVAEQRYKKREGRLQDVVFNGACKLAGIPASARQARKWNNGKGLAIRYKNDARKGL